MLALPLVFLILATGLNALTIKSNHMTMSRESNFDKAVTVVLENEGKLNRHKYDKGGVTNYGISLRYLQLVELDLNLDGKVNVEDILTIDSVIAAQIYKREWWDRYRYGEIKNLNIAIKIFDMSVWMGASQAHKLLQISINRIESPPIQVDGVLGTVTLGKVNSLIYNNKVKALLGELRDNSVHFIINLVADDNKLIGFRDGWLKRAGK